MRIAIIGSGISGLVCAYLLHKSHDISVFEANDYIGGHTNTVELERPDGVYSVNTGFIVFNEVTYPNFCKLINKLGVATQASNMSFSVRHERTGLEYSSKSFGALLAQQKNILSVSYWRMLREISKFRSKLGAHMDSKTADIDLSEFLQKHRFSQRFIDHFVVLLGASLGSIEPGKIMEFPARTFGRFFENHGFLQTTSPVEWRVISGGSHQYVKKLIASFEDKIELRTPVTHVERAEDYVKLAFSGRPQELFDQVIFATHSDQALRLLEEPTDDELRILRTVPYQENELILHTDESILPLNRNAWSSWNYFLTGEESNGASITYNMNMLQSIQSEETFCLSLNMRDRIEPEKVLGRYQYQHPIFINSSLSLQKSHGIISGNNRTHFCGAYWGDGFHEDGVNSALAVARFFGKKL